MTKRVILAGIVSAGLAFSLAAAVPQLKGSAENTFSQYL